MPEESQDSTGTVDQTTSVIEEQEEVVVETEPTTAGSETSPEGEGDDNSSISSVIHHPSTEQETENSQDQQQPIVESVEAEEHSPEISPPADVDGEDVTESTDDIPTPLPKINIEAANATHAQETNGRISRAVSVASSSNSVITTSPNASHVGFVKTAITRISQQKEAKKLPILLNSTKKTLEQLENGGFDSYLMFECLRLSIESKIVEVVLVALDCLSKIFTFQLFEAIQVPPPKSITALDKEDLPASDSQQQQSIVTPPPKINIIDAAIETIAAAFEGEGTDERIEIQVTRALLAATLNEQLPPHGSTLLRAVRQIYNIFILSLSPANQGIAQASLTQIVNVIFERVEKLHKASASTPGKSSSTVNLNNSERFSRSNSMQNVPTANNTPTTQTNSDQAEPLTLQNLNDLNDEQERIVDQENAVEDENEQTVKDAFLLFRAMCKLSVKNLENDSLDLRSHAVRSKLISLHIIHSIIKEHIDVFSSNDIVIRSSSTKEPTKFVDAIRQYLCLAISRNAASPISPVFETTLEIFWLIVSNLRSPFKREIPVFLNEIYFPVAELKTATSHQKRYFLIVIQRLSNDPRAIVEFYLNYDCDPSLPNICEKLTDYLTKLSLTRVEITPSQKAQYREHATKSISTYNLSQLPLLSISKLSSQSAITDNAMYPVEYALKVISLNSIVGILRSLNSWTQKGLSDTTRRSSLLASNRKRSSTFGSSTPIASTPIATTTPTISSNLNDLTADVDDPTEFESLKQRKTALLEGIRQFNFKPKRGIDYLLKEGFISDKSPQAISKFLLEQEGLDKAVIGEYMGEGNEENIAIMHAFVESMDFTNTFFVDAMRTFLQGFRLPGEAQKIDRYMLKFAERYTEGNPGVFAYADTAYVLAFSVIMLNTDQHSKSVKNRMTPEDFIKNNRGIDDGKSLPDEYLLKIFNEIANNEIKLDSEQRAALLAGDLNPIPQQTFALFGGKDVNREAYNQASKEISSKTEQAFKNLNRKNKKSSDVFYSASHIDHVKNIFDTLWMSFLAALTSPFKELDDDETINTCLEGLKLSIGIASVFELDYARTSFVGALVQFANVSNYNDLENKNVEAIILLLKITELYGDQLKDSWKDILTLISQVERLQLIAKGIQADSLPDVSNARVHRHSTDSQRSHSTTTTAAAAGYSLFGFGKKTSYAEQAQITHHSQQLNQFIGQRLISPDLTVHIDKVYTQSSQLNGTAIIDFIRALTEVASEEIESSLDSTTPRTFSLQKVIDVCYYNMGRIKLEWSPIWAVMGECFNDIGTKHNLSIVFFALDSLRQLSMRFMDIEELAGFKFQEDFLKPFAHILEHSREEQVTEMVLNCIENLIKVKGNKIKSGWKTIFAALRFSALDLNEKMVSKSFEISAVVYQTFGDNVLSSHEDTVSLLAVLREVSKNSRFPKIALHSLQTLKQINIRISSLDSEESKDQEIVAKNHNDIFKNLWFPALSSFNEVIMKCEDLEIRSKALNYLFDILVKCGNKFDSENWSLICNDLLFTIFGVLSNHWEISQFGTHDELSVWLSTTLIQALRNMIALFTHYFEPLSALLDGYLNLLISCICQENDTIARIGRSCLQQLITQNMEKFQTEHWEKITIAFEKLFELTAAKELFEADPLRKQNSGETEEQADQKSTKTGLDKASSKNAIVVKCILQLLMIESLSELFENETFYNLIAYEHLTRLSALLEKSFRFARTFNDDYNLRVRLWNAGVIEKLPNLLKQESSSAAVFISVTFRLYSDPKKITQKQKDIISTSLIPMCGSIVERYVQLDDATQQRNVATWRPVVVEILQGYCELEEKDFNKNCPHVYDLVLNILDKSVPSELRTAIKAFFARVGDVYINDEKN